MPLGSYGNFVQLTSEGCAHQTPSWSSDGRRLIWAAQCDGDWEIYRGDLAYTQDLTYWHKFTNSIMEAQLINVVKLTNTSAHDRFPRYSPDGSRIASRATAMATKRSTLCPWMAATSGA